LGEIAVGGHGSQLVLPQIQQLFGQLGGVDGLFGIGHGAIIGPEMCASQCSYRIAKAALKPAMLRTGRPYGEAFRPNAQRRIEFDGCRQRHGQRQDTSSD
jgi:hypothetical protein